MFFKEKILSSKELDNGTTHVISTSRNVNFLYIISLVIFLPFAYAFSGASGKEDINSGDDEWVNKDLKMCQEAFMNATNSIYRHNELHPQYKIELPTYNCNKVITSGTASGAIVPPPQRPITLSEKEMLDALHDKVCKKQINSPLCNDRGLFDRLYHLTEERLPNRKFYPILIGITNAESSLGLNYAKDLVGGTCFGRNNWGGAKYNIKDDNSREYSRSLNGFLYGEEFTGRFVDQYGCNLFPFKSIEEYWISKVNGMKYGYTSCLSHANPIWCISGSYVGKPHVRELSWINNVKQFLIYGYNF